MLQGNEAKAVVEAAYRLLVIDPSRPDERPFRLLPLQAARIAQTMSKRSFCFSCGSAHAP